MELQFAPMIAVSGVPRADLGRFWPVVGPMLARAAVRVGEPFDEGSWVYALTHQKGALWIAYEHGVGRRLKVVGAVLTCKLVDGSMLIWAVVGTRFQEWGPALLALIEPWARAEGCTRIETRAARAGWAKWAPTYGFHKLPGDHAGGVQWYGKEL